MLPPQNIFNFSDYESNNNNSNNNSSNNNFIESISSDSSSSDSNNNHLLDLLNKNNADVLSLTKCFICLSPAIDPLSCPKCNNFGCKKCFKKYFGGCSTKKCPLCKQEIKYDKLAINNTINEIEEVLAKDETSVKKIIDLSFMVGEKTINKEKQKEKLNNIIYKLLAIEEKIKSYRKEYELFFTKCKEIIDKAFDEYERKIKEVFNSLFPFEKEFNKLNNSKNNKNDNQEKIKFLVNEILSSKRNEFNQKKNFKDKKNNSHLNNLSMKNIKEVKKFISKPIIIIPDIYCYDIDIINIERNNIKQSTVKKKRYISFLGDFDIQYMFKIGNKYSSKCYLIFSPKNKNNITYFFFQKKIINKKCVDKVPMKLEIGDQNQCLYESIVDFDEFKDEDTKVITMEIKAHIFTMINN